MQKAAIVPIAVSTCGTTLPCASGAFYRSVVCCSTVATGAQRSRSLSTTLDALAKGFHEVDNVRALFLFLRRLDGLVDGLALDELA